MFVVLSIEPFSLSRMPVLLLLVGDPAKARNDNHTRFAKALREAGWSVQVENHDSLEVRRNGLMSGGRDLRTFDLIWPLGFGRLATFFDRMQLLTQIEDVPFVTSPTVLLTLHGKHRWLDVMPETHTSTDPAYLHEVISSGGDWVIKPTAGSYGRDVRLYREGEASLEELARYSRSLEDGYIMVQRFVPEIASGEKRTLVAGGRIIGTYLRIPTGGISSNLATGATPASGCLTTAELELVNPIARELADLGAGWAAIDTVDSWLMEVNVANPGGLETIAALGGSDLTAQAVQAILDWAAR
jgi:glutathione synthase